MAAVVLDGEGRFQRMADIDEIGVIAINGPNVFSGYLDPRHNEGVWLDIDGERWLNTGDLGRGTPKAISGWLGARRSSLSEAGTTSIPRSSRTLCRPTRRSRWSAAIGSPDAYAGELPVAYVQPKPGFAVTEAELMEHASRTIAERAAIPKRIKISSSLPVTAVGKLFKPALVELEIEETIRAEAERTGANVALIRVDRDPQRGLSCDRRSRRRSRRASGGSWPVRV